ncbi:hypothetical protein [Streptomyces flavofungini]|uniref:Uncharacterized protein n=1 Tax=Streptomyces flavofungini TaxID=68200 RepID=A0ABS0X0I1_9ACTN|nr:hypothetical protein [Streptomyces flavofungini]MBJ3806599.1 hypothetical protein [Streptomyces flavofungini]GHC61811.1 hypothetical protein GCM10010349_31910 [Streptomyces flavofungini]
MTNDNGTRQRMELSVAIRDLRDALEYKGLDLPGLRVDDRGQIELGTVSPYTGRMMARALIQGAQGDD